MEDWPPARFLIFKINLTLDVQILLKHSQSCTNFKTEICFFKFPNCSHVLFWGRGGGTFWQLENGAAKKIIYL